MNKLINELQGFTITIKLEMCFYFALRCMFNIFMTECLIERVIANLRKFKKNKMMISLDDSIEACQSARLVYTGNTGFTKSVPAVKLLNKFVVASTINGHRE